MTIRERILRTAQKLFDAKGLDGVSMRAVASRVGVTPMALYRHFEDKDALIDALVLGALNEWAKRVEAINAKNTADWLERLNNCFLDFALESPRRFEAAFLIPSKTARRFPDDFAAGRSPAAQIIVPRMEQAMAHYGIKKDSALEFWLTLWALTQGLITLYRAGRFAGGEKEFRALYRRATRRCVQSFLGEAT